jgi:hypothetical protein
MMKNFKPYPKHVLLAGAALLGLIVLLVTLVVPAMADGVLTVPWFTLDGGGGSSVGGVYTLNGTLAQPDAAGGALSGGTYTLQPGYWQRLAANQQIYLPQIIR